MHDIVADYRVLVEPNRLAVVVVVVVAEIEGALVRMNRYLEEVVELLH